MYAGVQYIDPGISVMIEICVIESNFIQVFSVTLMKITPKDQKKVCCSEYDAEETCIWTCNDENWLLLDYSTQFHI